LQPRPHQQRVVTRLINAVQPLLGQRECGSRNFLIQHSTGSGKSLTLAWLVAELLSVENRDDGGCFDLVLVLSMLSVPTTAWFACSKRNLPHDLYGRPAFQGTLSHVISSPTQAVSNIRSMCLKEVAMVMVAAALVMAVVTTILVGAVAVRALVIQMRSIVATEDRSLVALLPPLLLPPPLVRASHV
jgi:hypothetical protein